MRNNTFLPIIFFSFFSLLIIPYSLAQDEYYGLLSAILGPLPGVCVDIESPMCWECLIIAKLLPLAFFTALGFMISLVIVGKMLNPAQPKKTAVEYRITSIMLTIAIAIAILHVANTEDLILIFSRIYNVWYWASLMIVIVGVTYVFGGRAGMLLRYILSFVVILVFIWFMFSSPVPDIAYECMP
ncbi:MAG: hypothetical protein J7K98_00755 [Candidatus Aenigmarchaeota archaeon]|nr:hypothetical protein [Candidatus Aenigmarchaeota archaeon]